MRVAPASATAYSSSSADPTSTHLLLTSTSSPAHLALSNTTRSGTHSYLLFSFIAYVSSAPLST